MTIDWPNLVREHTPLVWRTAYRLLGREADAADCFQETFVSALAVARRQPVRDWGGLLQRLATTRGLDILRRRVRESHRAATPPDWHEVPAGGVGPVEQAEAVELSERLRLAMAELPPQQAEVFCLRNLEQLSYGEIAERLELSIDSVGVTLHRARGRLQSLLAGAQLTKRKQG